MNPVDPSPAVFVTDTFLVNLDKLPDTGLGKDADTIKRQAKSVASLIFETSLIHPSPNDQSTNIPGFEHEPKKGRATSFLVHERYVLTSGHAVCYDGENRLNVDYVRQLRVVFDYVMADKYGYRPIESSTVYKIKKVVDFSYTADADWALLKLDRKVLDRQPLELDMQADRDVELLDSVYMIGHPRGYPLKVTCKGQVIHTADTDNFKIAIAAFPGNSGSPVFSEKTGKVIGIERATQGWVTNIKGSCLQRISVDHLSATSVQAVPFFARVLKAGSLTSAHSYLMHKEQTKHPDEKKAELKCTTLLKSPVELCPTNKVYSLLATLCTKYLQGNMKSGYYFLWCLKKLTGATFTMPATINQGSVEQLLENLLATHGHIQQPDLFIETLLKPELFFSFPLFLQIMDFIDRTYVQNGWEKKLKVISAYLLKFSPQEKVDLVGKLLQDSHPEATLLGSDMQAAMLAKTLIVAHTSLQAVAQRTGWTPKAIEEFFEWPFCCMTRVEKYKSLAVTVVPFNGVKKVLVYDDIMMGIYVSPHSEKILPYLLAYSMRSDELVWGRPLDLRTGRTHLGRLGELVTLFTEDTFVIQILDPKTGTQISTVHLPIKRNTRYLEACLVERGWCYMRIVDKSGRHKVVAGPLADGKVDLQQEWDQEFDSPIFPLGPYAGYYMQMNKGLVVMAPNGKKVKLERCISAIVKGSILYGVEITENAISILTKRKLLIGPDIVSKREFCVSLMTGYAYPHIQCISDNGIAVLTSYNTNNNTIILVDTNARQVTYHNNHQQNYAINPTSGEAILYNGLQEKLLKVSVAGFTQLDSLPTNISQWPKLLHINRNGHLYIMRYVHYLPGLVL